MKDIGAIDVYKNVNIRLSENAIQILLTGVHELAFSVQKIQCGQDLLETHFEHARRKPMEGITI